MLRVVWIGVLLGAALRCGAEPAGSRSLARSISIALAPGVAMELVRIDPGTFVMGSEPHFAEHDETPERTVTITRPFYIGKYEVTQAQWTAVMGSNPSKFRGADLPVESVSWADCQAFCARVSAISGRTIALPTEAQWEFACRAGNTQRWFFGPDEGPLPRFAWWLDTAGGTTHRVGEKAPNPAGLHDVYGNVWEWCADWYRNPYDSADVSDPIGPRTGEARVTRGGAWGDDASQVRSAYRNSMGPDQRNAGTGFRCVALVEEKPRAAPPAVAP